MATLLDPADCGPVTPAFCQDVQAEAFDWPEHFCAPRLWRPRGVLPDPVDVAALARRLALWPGPVADAGRLDESPVGEAVVSACRVRRAPVHAKQHST